MNPSDARKTLINTDFSIDQVILLKNQSISIGGGIDVTIPHGLPFIPLVWFQWSFTSDFSIAYENNTGRFPSGNIGYYFDLQIAIEANSTNIVLRGNGVLGATTVYVRIFAFQPSTYNVPIAHTSAFSDNFTLNTDYNYMKLITKSVTGLIASGATLTIPHNLGIYPHTLMWLETTTGTIYPLQSSTPGQSINAELTTDSIIIRNNDFVSRYMHYRLYIDE